jgi:hypothetical protein
MQVEILRKSPASVKMISADDANYPVDCICGEPTVAKRALIVTLRS